MNRQVILFLGAVAAIAVIAALIFRPDGGEEEETTGTGSEQTVDTPTSSQRPYADTAEENMPEGVIPWEPGTAPFADLPEDQQEALRADAETLLGAWVTYSTDEQVMAERAETIRSIATSDLAEKIGEGEEPSQWEEKLAEVETATTGEVSGVAASEYHPEEGIVLMRADVTTSTTTTESNDPEVGEDTYLMRFIDTGDGRWKAEACELVVSPPAGVGD